MPIIPLATDRALAHATAADVEDWTGATAPANVDRLLLRASELIDAATTTSYTVDDDTGLATETEYSDALRDAVCAQIEQWILSGEVNDIDGMSGQSVSVGGLSVTRPGRLAPRAKTILNMAGLL